MALPVLLKTYGKPPTEQAFIWSALHAVIPAALFSAWHDKWIEPASRLRPRPTEVTDRLTVLDGEDESGHPTNPSGHSTVGGATAAILTSFFPDPGDQDELDKLAGHSGLARRWAGIHDRADHAFGMAPGAEVARWVDPGSPA